MKLYNYGKKYQIKFYVKGFQKSSANKEGGCVKLVIEY